MLTMIPGGPLLLETFTDRRGLDRLLYSEQVGVASRAIRPRPCALEDAVVLDERIKVGQVSRIDAFHAFELGCNASLLSEPGIHILPSERRTRPGWGGYTVPIMALSTTSGGIVSARPDMLDRVRSSLGPTTLDRPLGVAEFTRLHQVSRLAIPYAYTLSGHVLYADVDHFRSRPTRAVRLDRGDVRGTDLRRRFDGEIFVVWSLRGEIASWSAIKLKSPDVWEIAVVTEAPYRGQGLAKEVVSAATAHILEQGRLALYVHDRTNLASARVCRSLGYVEYAEEFFSEY
jgi:GNAT superfamily N-acetyltransferase